MASHQADHPFHTVLEELIIKDLVKLEPSIHDGLIDELDYSCYLNFAIKLAPVCKAVDNQE